MLTGPTGLRPIHRPILSRCKRGISARALRSGLTSLRCSRAAGLDPAGERPFAIKDCVNAMLGGRRSHYQFRKSESRTVDAVLTPLVASGRRYLIAKK